MQWLLNDLLELSRIGRLMNPPEEINFEGIVREALETVSGRLNDQNIRVALSMIATIFFIILCLIMLEISPYYN